MVIGAKKAPYPIVLTLFGIVISDRGQSWNE